MELKRYLFENEISVKDFAKLIDMTEAVISSLKTGHRMCGRKTARLIEKATNGQVTVEDLKYTCAKRNLKKLRIDEENTTKKLIENGIDDDLQVL